MFFAPNAQLLSVAPILNMTFTSMSNANSLDSAARAEAAASDKKRGGVEEGVVVLFR